MSNDPMDDDAMAVDSDDESMDDGAGGAPTAAALPGDGGEADAAAAKRRAIQAIMRDTTLSDLERRLRIQALMDGSAGVPGGGSAGASPSPAVPSVPTSSIAPAVPSPGAGAPHGLPEEAMSCVHYERKCNIVAPCCNKVFGCRVCHDEMTPSSHPPMNRFDVREVVCKECSTRQPAGNRCVRCGIQFGEYHCGICNLWMVESKKPFHCADCGFCRVGGRESFQHCHQCCMCISVNVYNDHNCMKDKYKNNCPVCREDMFSSRQSPQDLPCGHAIHAHCFRKLAGFDYRCPICKKTVVSQQSMAAAWAARARDIEMQPMPDDLARVVNIMCNDCETKSLNRNWHFLGVQCPGCSSFNTVVEQVISSGSEEPNPNVASGAGAS